MFEITSREHKALERFFELIRSDYDPTPKNVEAVVYKRFKVTREEMKVNKKYRGHEYVPARHAVHVLLKCLSGLEPGLIKNVYNKHRTTVIASLVSTRNLLLTGDKETVEDYKYFQVMFDKPNLIEDIKDGKYFNYNRKQ